MALASRATQCSAVSTQLSSVVAQSFDDKDQLVWSWLMGAATVKAEFGNPLVATSYELCLYDAGGLLGRASVPAGGQCAGRSCWKASTRGFRYADRDRTPHGLASVLLAEGTEP